MRIDRRQEGAERRDLRAGGHEPGDRGGRALVDVRGPGLERDRADLEELFALVRNGSKLYFVR